MMNSEESFMGDDESKKADADGDEGKSSYQGRILITRYHPHDSFHNASIATVNALQEPGMYVCVAVTLYYN